MESKKKPSTRKGRTSSGHSVDKSLKDDICFTIMPYGGWFDEYYQKIYRPAIEAVGLSARRADDVYRPSAITHDIWVLTSQAKVILADLSGKNPNVYYELGLAHALAKPAIMITDSEEEIPFDLRSLRIILYDRNEPNWGATLSSKIQIAIKEVLASPSSAVLPTFLLERQMDTMKLDLAKLAHEGQASTDGVERGTKPRMSPEEAMTFARRSVEKMAPDVFILNVLKDNGIDNETARTILDSIQSEKPAQRSVKGQHEKT